jgi:multidrug resistance efflux pump
VTKLSPINPEPLPTNKIIFMNQEQNEEKKADATKESIFKKPWVQSLILIVVIFGALGGFLYYQSKKDIVLIDNSSLQAPIVALSPTAGGTLNALYVHPGDIVAPGAQVALVGTTVITAKEGGIVSDTPEALGGYFNPGQKVVGVIVMSDMKVRGQIEETKGLKDLAVGQRATFTVDAFPGKTYSGIVDEIGATSVSTGVLFSISDQRPTEKFDVKVRFDVSAYPELKNGMSAKITVHTK